MSGANDLTSLAAVKQWLGLTSNADDAVLATLISGVSQAILADLSRPAVLPATYVETQDGGGTNEICLRQWPATGVQSVTIDGIALAASTSPCQAGYVLEMGPPGPPGFAQRVLFRHGAFAAGDQNVTITYRAGYEIIGETAIVPGVAPYAVAAQAPFGPWVADTGVGGAPGSYSVTAGLYTFAPTAAGLSVALSYAYIPNDLAQAALEWVADRYTARGRIGQSAKTLGGQETTSFIVKAMPDVVDRLLQPYRRITQ